MVLYTGIMRLLEMQSWIDLNRTMQLLMQLTLHGSSAEENYHGEK